MFSQHLKESQKYVSITVTDEVGIPLAGAFVILRNANVSFLPPTDEEGRFSDTIKFMEPLTQLAITRRRYQTEIIDFQEASEFEVVLTKRGFWFFLRRPWMWRIWKKG